MEVNMKSGNVLLTLVFLFLGSLFTYAGSSGDSATISLQIYYSGAQSGYLEPCG